MCGDGANDGAALKRAHIGVSLSESEASIAAPFTHGKPNISCIPKILSEGRGALATCFQLFRYMALYSMIQFSCCILLYFEGANLGNYQFLNQDMFLVFPIVVLMGETLAAPKLTKKRPSGNLLSLTNLLSVAIHIAICVSIQVRVFLECAEQPGYAKLRNDNFGANAIEVTTLYYLSNLQYILCAVVFSAGSAWKKPARANKLFFGWLIFATMFSLFLLFGTSSAVGLEPHRVWKHFFLTSDDVDVTTAWRLKIFGYFILNAILSMLFEFEALPHVKSLIGKLKNRHYTNTVYGKGGLPEDGCKKYHIIRRKFEDKWFVEPKPFTGKSPAYNNNASNDSGNNDTSSFSSNAATPPFHSVISPPSPPSSSSPNSSSSSSSSRALYGSTTASEAGSRVTASSSSSPSSSSSSSSSSNGGIMSRVWNMLGRSSTGTGSSTEETQPLLPHKV